MKRYKDNKENRRLGRVGLLYNKQKGGNLTERDMMENFIDDWEKYDEDGEITKTILLLKTKTKEYREEKYCGGTEDTIENLCETFYNKYIDEVMTYIKYLYELYPDRLFMILKEHLQAIINKIEDKMGMTEEAASMYIGPGFSENTLKQIFRPLEQALLMIEFKDTKELMDNLRTKFRKPKPIPRLRTVKPRGITFQNQEEVRLESEHLFNDCPLNLRPDTRGLEGDYCGGWDMYRTKNDFLCCLPPSQPTQSRSRSVSSKSGATRRSRSRSIQRRPSFL